MTDSAHGARRIAFFGGSFDPPHRGHLAVARAAQLALDLDTVLFAPVGSQPLKPDGASAGFEDRLAMTELAIKSKPNFAISLADAPVPGASHNYTIDTLLRLRAELPDDSVLFCLLGADSFLALRHWRRGADIPFAAPLIVASRPGQQLEDLAAALPPGISINAAPVSNSSNGIEVRTFALRNSAGAATPFYLLPGLEIEVSASEIRSQAQAAHGRLGAGHDLLPEPVSDYIATHGLYR